jgi:adenosylcobinamide-phosphate synthase
VFLLSVASKTEHEDAALNAVSSMYWSEAFCSAWCTVLAMATALAVDGMFGEPPVQLHPVVFMGRYLGAIGPRLWVLPKQQARLAGIAAWCLGGVLVLSAALLLSACVQGWQDVHVQLDAKQSLGRSLLFSSMHGLLLGLLLKPLMAWRMLKEEVASVEHALSFSLSAGQHRLARLVSRDTAVLNEQQIRESAIETLAENLNDSVVAPVFWFALGGLPAAAVYRFANTADAMWGYRDHRRWMGCWAARVDDLLSWWPARLTALALCLSAWRWPGWLRLSREASQTPSPNGGWPMGTMAVLLGVHLGKVGVYCLNENARAPVFEDTQQSLKWSARAVWCVYGVLAVTTELTTLLLSRV